MIRSMYDTIVSYYFHNSKHHNTYDKDISNFIRDSSLGIDKWINYINSWSPFLDNEKVYVISYEKLHKNANDEIAKLLYYLNIFIDEDLLNSAILSSSFENMKRVEVKHGIANHNHDRTNEDSRRVRKGKINGYVDYLKGDDIDFIKTRCKKRLSLKSKLFLSKFYNID